MPHQPRKPAIVLAQAPAALKRFQNRPNQNATPSIGAIFSQVFKPEITFGILNATHKPALTIISAAIRPTQR
jgi:hypothetical protein